MDFGIRGKRALVAGSSAGIGRACADALAGEGVDVFLVSRNEARLRRAAEEIRERHEVRVAFAAADIATAGGADAAFDAALTTFGGVDILVNNAGGPKPGAFSSLSDSDWQKAVDLNLMSTVRLTRRAIEGMIDRSWGRIINIMSTSVKQPIEGLMLSNAVRMAVVGFAKTLTTEVSQHGITINTVAPGYTDTDRSRELAATRAKAEGVGVEEILERWMKETPLRRIGEAHEIAAAVAFLASEPAAYVNGVVLAVDGGRVKTAL